MRSHAVKEHPYPLLPSCPGAGGKRKMSVSSTRFPGDRKSPSPKAGEPFECFCILPPSATCRRIFLSAAGENVCAASSAPSHRRLSFRQKRLTLLNHSAQWFTPAVSTAAVLTQAPASPPFSPPSGPRTRDQLRNQSPPNSFKIKTMKNSPYHFSGINSSSFSYSTITHNPARLLPL